MTEAAAAAARDERRPRRRWLPPGLLVLVTSLALLPSLTAEPHLDSLPRIVENPEIERVWPPWRHFVDPHTSTVLPTIVQYRPMLPLVLSLERAAAEALGLPKLPALHAGNLLVHLAAVLLFWQLVRELAGPWSAGTALAARREGLAFWSAALYGLHPVAAVSVNYLAALDLLLMQAFLLGALLAHARWRRLGGGLRAALPPLLLALSILSKTNAAAAPIVIFFFELSFGRGAPLAPRTWLRVLPSALVTAAFFAWTRFGLAFSDASMLVVERPAWEYPVSQLRLHVTWYLRNFAWPFHLRPLPDLQPSASPFDPVALAGLLLVLACVALAWRKRRTLPLVSFALGAYWGLFTPTSSLLPFRLLATDYRQHPSLPWLCLLGVAALGFLPAGRPRRLVLLGFAAWLAVGTAWVNRTWESERSLWSQSVRRGGTSIAHHNLAMATMGEDPRLGERLFRRALEIHPGNVRSHVSLGLLLHREGRTAEGLWHVRHAVELAPDWGSPHHWLARALETEGRLEEAAVHSARAAELEPRNPRHPLLAARQAQALGRHEEAVERLRSLHERSGPSGNSWFVLAWSLDRLDRVDEAAAAYLRFLDEHPESGQVRFNLAHLLARSGRCEQARPHYEALLAREPAHAAARAGLERCRTEAAGP